MYSLLHVLDGRPHHKVMVPNKKPMEELPLAQVIRERVSQCYVSEECGPGNAIAFVEYGKAGAHKVTTGHHFDSGERFAPRDMSIKPKGVEQETLNLVIYL